MKISYQSTVLGKRKARTTTENLVLHLTSPSSTSNPELLDPGPSTPAKAPILINGNLVANTEKRYHCTYQGCEKAYSKPSRLEEHERSHTGQRPYVCETCEKSYLRETHLHAHTRSHLPNEMRPFICDKDGCGKRFWTSQHLQVHLSWHNGAKPYKCQETGCDEAFAKHHQLRTHISSIHAPGAKPYQCDHEGCSKSFKTNQHLRAHQKTHDAKRYTCVHPSCLSESESTRKYFPTWSSLQSHIKKEHPPTCSHPSCNDKTFSNPGNLKAHLKLHEQRNAEDELQNLDGTDEEDEAPLKKRRRGGEYGRDWKCEVAGCDKDFKSKRALQTHVNVTHHGRRDFACIHKDCTHTFGYKHLLQHHVAKVHLPESERSGTDASASCKEFNLDEDPPHKFQDKFDIDLITGNTYSKQAEVNLKNCTVLRCPYPTMNGLLQEDEIQVQLSASASNRACEYVFSRGYDLRRHLSASHNVVVSKEVVDRWVRTRKQKIS